MPIVSNTSPILNLAIIDQLDLLREQFGEISIPPAVLEELRITENLPGSQHVREAIEAGWLGVETVQDHPFVLMLERAGQGRSGSHCASFAGQGGMDTARRAGRSPGCKVVGIARNRCIGCLVAGVA